MSFPEGAWDCHAHVIEDATAYPLSPRRGYDPPLAPLEDYLALLDRLGVARGVLVQPSVYGFDNRCLLGALDRAEGRLAGIVVPPPDASPADLEAMHGRGARGVRCNVLNPGGLDPDVVKGWAPALRDLGWRVELQLDVAGVEDLGAYVDGFGVPVVVDHMGRPRPGCTDPALPALRRLVQLVADGRCHVKLSAPYRLSEEGPPWSDVAPLARALLRANPRACLWATDWPHTETKGPVEQSGLLEALDAWCPTSSPERRIVLAETPSALHAS